MSDSIKSDFSVSNNLSGENGVLTEAGAQRNPALESATLLFQMAPGMSVPYEYGGIAEEIEGYRKSAWIGTTLMISPIYDVIGPDACKFLNSICVNDFSKLKYTGLRHAVICNDKGQVLTDGVVIRIAEDRYRTYWLNPPLQYLVESSDMDVHGEDMTGTEYFIQIDGERSLEILEEAFQQDLHDIKFTKRRVVDVDGMKVNVIRLGMSGNLAYEIHGPIAEYAAIYDKVWEAGEKFGARKLGMHAYNLFNHTEAGFPNITIHYPLPWFESNEGLTKWCYDHPQASAYNINRYLTGSVGDDLQSRFVTPYDIGCGMLVRFDHDFTGKEALQKMADAPARVPVTLEWDPEDLGAVFAACCTRGGEPVDDIAQPSDLMLAANAFNGRCEYRADKVFDANGAEVGITSGRIRSYNYNAVISLGFIAPEQAHEGSIVTVLWGTPGTKQMPVKAKVCHFPYNIDYVRNEDRDVEDIPHRFERKE